MFRKYLAHLKTMYSRAFHIISPNPDIQTLRENLINLACSINISSKIIACTLSKLTVKDCEFLMKGEIANLPITDDELCTILDQISLEERRAINTQLDSAGYHYGFLLDISSTTQFSNEGTTFYHYLHVQLDDGDILDDDGPEGDIEPGVEFEEKPQPKAMAIAAGASK